MGKEEIKMVKWIFLSSLILLKEFGIVWGIIFFALFIFSCNSDFDTAPTSFSAAGKAATGGIITEADSCLVIEWDCDTSEWAVREDSVYTVFYGDSLRFMTQGNFVHVENYIESDRKRVYVASETADIYDRYRAAFRFTEGKCGLWSNAVVDTSLTIRIYKGDVEIGISGLG